MIYRLFFKGQFLSQHRDFEDARAQARWTYFEWTSGAWDGEFTPPGFLIACVNLDSPSNHQDKKVVCI